jgi:hypothetical protein
MKPISEKTCTQAWIAAAAHLLQQPECRDYNVILEIAEPMTLTAPEKTIYSAVDTFLRSHKKPGINTIINTIFPAGFYSRNGPTDVIKNYGSIAAKIRHHPANNRWGTYAYRMLTPRKDRDGHDFVPVEAIIEKLKIQLKNKSTLRAAYELNLIDPMVDIPIYEADKDHDHTIGGPCLSHVSFKLKEDHSLMLTAFYRSHYYVQRALGNLFGLAWLQDFVAKEAKVKTAQLVCISSMALLETDKAWGKGETTKLLTHCRTTLNPPEHKVSSKTRAEKSVNTV